MGYSEQHKYYKIYNPITKRVVVRNNVKFMEDKCWSDSANTLAENPQAVTFDLPAHSPNMPRLQVQQQQCNTPFVLSEFLVMTTLLI